MNEQEIAKWFLSRRPIFRQAYVVIKNQIAFVYAQLSEKDQFKNWARISLKEVESLNELNPYEWN